MRNIHGLLNVGPSKSHDCGHSNSVESRQSQHYSSDQLVPKGRISRTPKKKTARSLPRPDLHPLFMIRRPPVHQRLMSRREFASRANCQSACSFMNSATWQARHGGQSQRRGEPRDRVAAVTGFAGSFGSAGSCHNWCLPVRMPWMRFVSNIFRAIRRGIRSDIDMRIIRPKVWVKVVN